MKRLSSFLCLLILSSLVTSCGSGNAIPSAAELYDKTVNGVALEELMEIDDTIIERQYKGIALDTIADKRVSVCASGAYADEIAVFVVKDKNDAGALKSVLEKRLSSQSDKFRDYIPEEMTKLDNAEIVVRDTVLLLAVCSDSTKAADNFLRSIK